MKITNEYGLPEAFLNFARDDKYTKGKADISVTTLIGQPKSSPHERQAQFRYRFLMLWIRFGPCLVQPFITF